ncbi:MAG: hypothetical protein ACRDCE_22315, partial [Cetobacterium sp.]|uniref:hypothetical protein n=1 Tax=Cetobacterium sp. TaxID=2071632 RepID=UPI003EE7C8F1
MKKPVYVVEDVLNDLVTMPTVIAVARKHGISERTVRRIRDNNKTKMAPMIIEAKLDANPVAKAYVTPERVEEKSVAPEVEYEWTASKKHITIYEGDKTYNANNSHPRFQELLSMLLSNKVKEVVDIIDVKHAFIKINQGKVRIENETVFYGDIQISNGVTERILKLISDGKDPAHMVNFFEKLMENPSRRAVYELFGFLEHNDIEITEDGDFIAWKRVRSDYYDLYTGKMLNKPGTRVEVERWQVDEDSSVTCSHGLHVCAKHYLNNYYGGKGTILKVKVNPKDVVAIPTDYKNAKMRCAGYFCLEDTKTKNA